MARKHTVRVTIDLTPELNERLEKLTQITSSNSKADTIRDALRVYEYLAEKNQEGYEVLQRKDERVEIIPLFIQRLKVNIRK